MEFALVEYGLFVFVQIFDRVFDRDDMAADIFIDLIDQARQRGGFAAAGWAGDQKEALFFPAEFQQDRRQSQFLR